ncbi:hypothetical protein [Rahnella sp. PCH160]|uniref:hypothetical protein n=1 Tax=Rahnella sp. PCH160 TaxID=3447928 RepID=UPI0039FDA1D9
MHTAAIIQKAYDDATRRTLDEWNTHPDTGVIRTEPFYHPTRLAITSGNRAGPDMAGLLSALETAANGDPLADVAPLTGMHFTFFCITQALYDKPEDAEGIAGLTDIFRKHCDGHTLHIQDLRLIALPDQLLLAGFPDEKSQRVRQSLVDDLMKTPWAEKIRERFPHTEIPQVFWHSTLLRYSAQYLPAPLRVWFLENQHKSFGSLSLPVKLVMTNYNWTETLTLA